MKMKSMIGILILSVFTACTAPLTEEQARQSVEELLSKAVEKNDNVHLGILKVYSETLGIDWEFASGDAVPDDVYHLASIGKTFTSVVLAQLVEEGVIGYDDPISSYLEPEVTEGLFVVNGTNYTDQVTVRHLVSHTSGAADFFQTEEVLASLTDDPEHIWTVEETLDYAREHLTAVGAPGEVFHYSDTGYNLLGLVIESASRGSLDRLITERIIEPLGMNDTVYLYDKDGILLSEIDWAPIYLGDHIATTENLSIDWAGGGIISTTKDQLKFFRALNAGELISAETLAGFFDTRKFAPGIEYGYAVFSIDMNSVMFIVPQSYAMWGNMGSIATFMLYNPANDVYLIGAFNQFDFVEKQVRLLMQVVGTIERIENTE